MTVDPDRVTIVRALLDHLGLTAADLTDTTSRAVPTIAEYLPRVEAAASPGTRHSYHSYWNRMATTLGDRRLDTVTASDIEALMRQATSGARSRRNSRHGRHAGEHFVAAARAFYTRAIADGYLSAVDSPAHRVRKPRRLPNTRRALTPKELEEINRAARSGGNDIVLDARLLRLHTETACRRGGALALRLIDLDPDHALIRLTEKGGTQRWQPITPMLAARLLEHAHARGAVAPTDKLLRYRNGQPASYRRYEPAVETHRTSAPVGSRAGHLHPLATPHHPHLGRTALRLWSSSRLRRPHRQPRTRHHHLHQSRPPRRRHRPGRHDRPTPSASRRTRRTVPAHAPGQGRRRPVAPPWNSALTQSSGDAARGRVDVGAGGQWRDTRPQVADTRRNNPLGCQRLESPRLAQKHSAQSAAVRHLRGFWLQSVTPLAVGPQC